MKLRNISVTLLILTIASINLYSQEILVAENNKADSLVKVSYQFYESKPETFISLNKAAFLLYKKSDSKKEMAQVLQNLAFVYTEKIKDYKLANTNITLSIGLWKELNNTLQEANLLKYKGMINGYLKNYNTAKRDIRLAIKKFKELNYSNGIYISYLDLAKVYEQESKLDSSIYYANLNKKYFEEQKDTFRIFTVNNNLINYYLHSKEYNKAKEISVSNKQMLSSDKVKESDREEFKKICQLNRF